MHPALPGRKQISIPPCFTAHCGLFVRYRVTQRGNVVTRYNARYTCIVPRSQVGRGPRRAPWSHTSRVDGYGPGLGPADSPSFSLCAKAQRPLSTLFS
nr:hypothetical protein [uncultured bacterium]